MSTSRCILLDHNHIGDQHIPSFVYSIRLVLQDYEHLMLHTPLYAHIGDQHIPFIMVVTEMGCIGKGKQKGHLTSALPGCPKFRIFESRTGLF
jgi:hypothetical protein